MSIAPQNQPAAAFPGWLVRNPALTLALVAILVRYGLPLVVSGFDEGVAGLLWLGGRMVLAPFSLIATWVDPWLRPFPELVDVGATAVLGLLPYLAVDAACRRLVRRRQPTTAVEEFRKEGSI